MARFFFSSRRRHTRCYRDWSSDVCSSDLGQRGALAVAEASGLPRPQRRTDRHLRETAEVIELLADQARLELRLGLRAQVLPGAATAAARRSEEHTSELQSR